MRNLFFFSAATVVLSAFLVTSASAFAANFSIQLSKDTSNNQSLTVRYDLIGKVLLVKGACEVDSFRFRYSEGDDLEDYVAIKKANDGKSCDFSRQLSAKGLDYGKLFELRTYKLNGQNPNLVDTVFAQIPCASTAQVMSGKSNAKDNTVVLGKKQSIKVETCPAAPKAANSHVPSVTPIVTGTGNTQVQQDKPQQSCSVSSKVNEEFSRGAVNISARCSLTETVDIIIMQGDRILNKDKTRVSLAANLAAELPAIPRNSQVSNVYEVEIRKLNGSTLLKQNITVLKDPSFHHNPDGRYKTELKITPKEEETTVFRGVYWEAKISATITDRDIEDNFPQDAILVQLIKVSKDQSGNVVSEKVVDGYSYSFNVSTGREVSFKVSAKFEQPRLIGKNHWDQDSVLQKGNNYFKIRIYDAFQKEKHVDLDEVDVLVNSNLEDEK